VPRQTGQTTSLETTRASLHHDRITRHGDTAHNSISPLYQCWLNIKQRCLNHKNPDFEHYGGRGISMATEWIDDFVAFKIYVNQNLGPRPSSKHTIDRIENSEGYEAGNLKGSTRTEQNHNTRRSPINKAVDAALSNL
jgi:hypothetical protein